MTTARRIAAGLAVVTSSLVLADAPGIVEAAPLRATFVVGTTDPVAAADQAVVDHLVARGFEVDAVDDDAVDASDADGRDLVIISTSVAASRVGDTFTDVEVPLINWEPYLHDDLGFLVSGDSGQTSKTKTYEITSPAHPIAGGLTGVVEVTSAPQPLSFGRVGDGAEIIARESSSSARPVVFAFEQGAAMETIPAPARRVGFSATARTPLAWTADGVALFDAAIDWLVGGTSSANVAPSVFAGDDLVVRAGQAVTLTGTVDDDGQVAAVPTLAWSGPPEAVFDSPAEITTTVTFTGPGAYTVTLTADDGEFVVSDDVEVTVTDEPPPGPERVLWVTNSSTPPIGDVPGIERLESQGRIVTVVDDNVVTAADADAAELVVITSSVSPSRVGDTFASVPVPVLIWEPYLYDDMGFVSGKGVKGQSTSLKRVDIEAPGDVLAAGLAGSPEVVSPKKPMSWAVPAGDVRIVATLDNSSTRATIFAYEAGSMMQSTTAPARRVGYFLSTSGPARHTADGWRLWDAAIDWALHGDAVPEPPVALAAATPTAGEAPLSVAFDGSGSSDPDEDIVGFAWDFGDGTTVNGAEAVHVYTDVGTFEATLTVTDSVGLVDTDAVTIDVTSPTAPTGLIVVDAPIGPFPHAVAFDATGSTDPDDAIVVYEWDFGDGATATGPVVSHLYTAAGDFVVTLTVGDEAGHRSSVSTPIRVTARPDAVAAVTTSGAVAPVTAVFDASGSTDADDGIISYQWDLGDGATATGITAEHVYAEPGDYDVVLTVVDVDGLSATDTITVAVTSDWLVAPQNFRTQLSVDASSVARSDAVAVIDIDFGGLLGALGSSSPTLDPDSIRVVEVDADREPVGGDVAFQFDPSDSFDPTTNATGELLVLLSGITEPGVARTFDVYFDTAGRGYGAPDVAARIDTTSGVLDEGRAAIRFATPSGDWWYDVEGGGFSSLDDLDGDDWLTYSAAPGASGQFRGMPNAVFPEGYFHPGGADMDTRLLVDGPLRATIESSSPDGTYVTRWHVYPSHAEMEMRRAGGDYWFLYEGTPGGTFNGPHDNLVFADGSSIGVRDEFFADLPASASGPEWVYFADGFDDRSLLLAHLDDDDVVDSYRDMNDAMTVFGFGRAVAADPLLETAGERFVVALIESKAFGPTEQAIRATLEPLAISVGPIETRIVGAVPPSASASASATTGSSPLSVTFDATASADDGGVVSYEWDLGQGSTATGPIVDAVYADNGSFIATLTVTDDDGLTDTEQVFIAVGRAPLTRSDDGLLVLYEFGETSGAAVADTSGTGEPLDLTIADPGNVVRLPEGGLQIVDPTVVASSTPASKVVDGVVATDEITIEAWAESADVDQNGPARLFGISESPTVRNVMVGQGVSGSTGDRIETRIRTTATDDNGKPALRTASGSFSTALTHIVSSRSADGTVRTYLDGALIAEDSGGGDLSNWVPELPLLLANEADGSRPWLGTLHLVAVYDRALTAGEVCVHRGAGPTHGFPTGLSLGPSVCLTSSSPTTDTTQPITFDASTSRDPDGIIVDFTWDFGDGTTTDGASDIVAHQYAVPGTYEVTVAATDDNGNRAVASIAVDVQPATGGRLDWTLVQSPDPRLPDPRAGGGERDQQTATLIGDVDGDGDDDIVIGQRRDPGPSVVWYEYVDQAVGWVLHEIEAEVLPIDAGGDIHDVDGDGDLDVIFGGDGSSTDVWWWENPLPAGDPTAPWSRYEIKSGGGRQHHDMRFGDVDGDGVDEFVFWNQQPRPGGEKLFVAEIPSDPRVAGWPTELIYQGTTPSEGMDLADVDLDGVVDIVGAGLWFEHQGDGSFVPHDIDADYSFSRTAVGQLIPGGRPEIVMSSGDAIDPLNWYEWDPAADVWVAHELVAAYDYGHSLELGDVDGDSHLDIFAAEMVSPSDDTALENPGALTQVYFGDGAGGFDADTIAVGVDNHESRLGDIDDDGDLDIVGKPFNVGVPGLNLWINEGVNHFGRFERVAVDASRPWTALFVKHADIDGDGDDDIVTGGWWYRNPGADGGDWERNALGDPLYNIADVADLDGDGDIDVIGTSWQDSADSPDADFHWGQNDGSGGFTIHPAVDTGDGPFLQGAAIAVLEDGGPLELVLSWNNADDTGIPTRTIVVPDDLAENPAQAPWEQRTLSPDSEGEAVVVVDVDGDGAVDIFTGSNWLRNDPGDVWTTIDIFPLRTGLPDRTVLSDVDGDGDADAVIGNGHDPQGELSWYERPDDPEGEWTHHLIANLVNPQSVDVADMDGDGDPDVLVGEHNKDALTSSRLIFYENVDGLGSEWRQHIIHVGDEHHDGAVLVDLDADGDLDVISIGFIQNRVVAYYNRVGG